MDRLFPLNSDGSNGMNTGAGVHPPETMMHVPLFQTIFDNLDKFRK